MPLALVGTSKRMSLRNKEIIVTATPSGSYTAGGDTVNLGAISDANRQGATIGYPGNIEQYEVINFPVGYNATLVPGGTLATWKLKVLQGGAAVSNPEAEIPAAAYPAGVLAGTFQFRFIGKKLQM